MNMAYEHEVEGVIDNIISLLYVIKVNHPDSTFFFDEHLDQTEKIIKITH